MASSRSSALLRSLDRLLGVPLVGALGAARRVRRRHPPGEIRRIGCLKTAAIGDTVLLSGVIRDLVAQTGAEVHLFAGTSNAGAARLIEGVRDVVVLPVTRPVSAIRLLRAVPLDVLIDFGSWPRIDAVLSALSGAPWTVGFRTRGQRRHYAYDRTVEHSDRVHELDNYRRLVQAIGVTSASEPRLGSGEPVPSSLLPRRRFVVCHMWSGGFEGWHKEWPAERWHSVVAHFARRGYDVVLTGHAADAAATAAFRGSLPEGVDAVHDVAGILTLAQTLELIRAAALVVSVNTGIMHVAAAAGTALVSVEGPVPVGRWGPIGRRAISVVSPHPGAGYLNLGWEYDGAAADTMSAIPADSVIAAADSLLSGAGA